MSPLGSLAKQSREELLAAGLQKPWAAIRVKQLVPPCGVAECLASQWMLEADKTGSKPCLLLLAMELGQDTSPLYPSHLSQAAAKTTVVTPGGCYVMGGKLCGVWRVSGTCKEFGVYCWGQQRQP